MEKTEGEIELGRKKYIDAALGGITVGVVVAVAMAPAVFIAEYDDGRFNPFASDGVVMEWTGRILGG